MKVWLLDTIHLDSLDSLIIFQIDFLFFEVSSRMAVGILSVRWDIHTQGKGGRGHL